MSKLILLHGWALNPEMKTKWQPFLDQLKKLGIKYQFLNLPGLSAPLDKVWDLADYSDWLDQQLPPTGQVMLLGHSFGGKLAIHYTAAHPKKVAKLILISSSGLRDQSWSARLRRGLFKTVAKAGKKLVKAELARKLLYCLAREQDYYQAPPTLRKTMAKVLEAEIDRDLVKISIPTLIIWGDSDQTTPLKNAQLINQQIRSSQLEIISQARHSPQYTHPQVVAKLVNKFINND